MRFYERNRLFKILKNSIAKVRNSIIQKYKKRTYKHLNELWTRDSHIINELFLNKTYDVQELQNCRELEHQVGRYRNQKKVMEEVSRLCIPGDILEFGTWNGTSIIVLAKIIKELELNRHIVGVDSFQGLPSHSTVWKKGQFSDASKKRTHLHIANNIPTKQVFHLIDGWFSDSHTAEEIYQAVSDVCVVHFDADLGSSTLEALAIVERYLVDLKHDIYFLFDDWGIHPDEVPDAFCSWIHMATKKYSISAEKISSTRFTRYFRISRN